MSLRNIQAELKLLYLLQGQTKERAFLGHMDQQLKENKGMVLPDAVSRQQRVITKY